MDKAIELAKKSQERSAALAAAEAVRAKVIQAEEQAFTAREREIAERRKLDRLIAAHARPSARRCGSPPRPRPR